jgi:hypothetical protein
MSLRGRWAEHRRRLAERRGREPVGLTVVPSEQEAEVICGLLRANGIDCFHRKTDMAGALTRFGSPLGPYEVLVPADRLAEARELARPLEA